MKGLICYFSTTGNTKLVCQYLASRISSISLELFDIKEKQILDLSSYDIIGLATYADFLAPPLLIRNFIRSLPMQAGKPAFVLNTYGNINGQTLLSLKQLAKLQGFKVVAGYALNTPENYPPLVAGGLANTRFPTQVQLEEFQKFIMNLEQLGITLAQGGTLREAHLDLDLMNRLIPPLPRFLGQKLMGEKMVDQLACTKCGLCVKSCPYQAIEMREEPYFDEKKCAACWSCYNHCPTKAIYTKKLKGKGHYSEPGVELREKLTIE